MIYEPFLASCIGSASLVCRHHLMFNRKFMIIVGICFLIAAPISYFITDYYYSTFAYRAPIAVWVFVVALLAVLVITTLVVTLASLRTATSNPVEALRTE